MANNPQELTSISLLVRARSHDSRAWQQLVDIYTPLVSHWCRSAGVSAGEINDVVQETFAAVVRGLPEFEHGGVGQTFRGWLRTIVKNRLIDRYRAQANQLPATGGSEHYRQLGQLRDPLSEPSADSEPFETGLVFRAAVDIIRSEFEAQTAEAFWLTTIEEVNPAVVSQQLNMTLNAVYKAKSRVLRRLREVLEGFE